MGKGVLVSPTVHGNLLTGPTATDIDDKEQTATAAEELESLMSRAVLSVKGIPFRQVITSFAGLRAHEDGDDFVIGEAEDAPGFFDAAGIESPGLSSAPLLAGGWQKKWQRNCMRQRRKTGTAEEKASYARSF